MNDRNVVNISNELNVIEDHIKIYSELEYKDGYNCFTSNIRYPFSGLDEDKFNEIRNIVVEKLREYWNDKNEEMIKLCEQQKY